MSDGVTVPPPLVGLVSVGVGVQTGVAVGVGVPYWEIAALLPDWPWMRETGAGGAEHQPGDEHPENGKA